MIPNVLADRYASNEMVGVFDATNRVRLERELWVAVLEAQVELGLPAPEGAVAAYRAVVNDIDHASILERELETRHDVKARLDEFNALAGFEEAHKGLTSRDVTENVEQLLTWRALALVEQRTVALMTMLAERAAEYAAVAMVGRTHNVAAQPTTVGKRFAQVGEELLAAHAHLRSVQEGFALRGIKGPVGSQQDQLDLLGSVERVEALEQGIAAHLGIERVLGAVGQVYPRSLDYAVVAGLVQLASAPANFALGVRLMAGHELATEGFRPGQVGSSAMPHKMNTRSCERISGLHTILQGHLTMAAGLTGDQWHEGDVSCSVVRRVVLPDAFFALDGLYETTFSVLRDFGIFPAVIEAELRRYLPFLSTTALLMWAVRKGAGRETAHELIKKHAVDVALEMRDGTGDGNLLLERLATDPAFPGQISEITAVSGDVAANLGTIDRQIAQFCARVADVRAERGDVDYRGAAVR